MNLQLKIALIRLLAEAESSRLKNQRDKMKECRSRFSPEKKRELYAKHRQWYKRRAEMDGRTLRKTPRPKGTVSVKQRKVEEAENQRRYSNRHPERRRAQFRAYYYRNKRKILDYQKFKRDTDPQKNLERKIRRRIWEAFSKSKNGLRSHYRTIKILGCSFAELRIHIEGLFKLGMSWDAVIDSRIHLDHIKPIASFDLTDPAQVAACFHYTNLQPLFALDNLRKGDKLDFVVKQN